MVMRKQRSPNDIEANALEIVNIVSFYTVQSDLLFGYSETTSDIKVLKNYLEHRLFKRPAK